MYYVLSMQRKNCINVENTVYIIVQLQNIGSTPVYSTFQ